MEQILSVLRWILHKTSILVLVFIITFLIPIISITSNLTDSSQVKSWLTDSGFYQNLLDESATLINDKDFDEAEEVKGTAIDTKALINALLPTIPAEFVQSQTEEFIDGMYAWLEGETATPEFSISLSSQADEIEKALTKELTRQAKKLPECTSASQVQQDFDLADAKCIPPGYSVVTEAKKFSKKFVNKKDGPVQTTYTGEDLEIDDDDLLNVPTAYSALELMPLFFWAFLIGASAIVILTSRGWLRGLRHVGGTLVITSGILLLLSVLAAQLDDAPGKYFIDSQDQDVKNIAAKNILEPVAQTITSDMVKTSMTYLIIVLIIGVVCFMLGRYYAKKMEGSTPKKANKKDDVPELLKDNDDSGNFINKIHDEKTQKPQKSKMREKIKNKLIQ